MVSSISILEIVLTWSIVFGLFGMYVAAQVRRKIAEGLILGVLFGPLGVIIVALLPADETIDVEASIAHKTDEDREDEEDAKVRESLRNLTGKSIQ